MWHDQEPEERGFPPSDSPVVRIPLPRARVIATWILLGINILVFLASIGLSLLLTGRIGPHPIALFYLGWKDNLLISQGEYWRFITAMFLHGNIVHILFNGFALYVLGPEMERIYGTVRFLAVYFLAGLGGGIASYAFSPSPSVGASGAIFGLIGGLAVFYYLGRNILGDAGRQQLQSMVVVILLNLFIGFGASGVIDNYAHIGGLVVGAASGWMLAPRYAIDTGRYPPALVKQYSNLNWAGAAAILLVLVALLMVIQPPILQR
jgi:rhomboid protease GluP